MTTFNNLYSVQEDLVYLICEDAGCSPYIVFGGLKSEFQERAESEKRSGLYMGVRRDKFPVYIPKGSLVIRTNNRNISIYDDKYEKFTGRYSLSWPHEGIGKDEQALLNNAKDLTNEIVYQDIPGIRKNIDIPEISLTKSDNISVAINLYEVLSKHGHNIINPTYLDIIKSSINPPEITRLSYKEIEKAINESQHIFKKDSNLYVPVIYKEEWCFINPADFKIYVGPDYDGLTEVYELSDKTEALWLAEEEKNRRKDKNTEAKKKIELLKENQENIYLVVSGDIGVNCGDYECDKNITTIHGVYKNYKQAQDKFISLVEERGWPEELEPEQIELKKSEGFMSWDYDMVTDYYQIITTHIDQENIF